jgi:hypothetical protein
MPPPDVILAGLQKIANDWYPVAIGWHVGLAVLLFTRLAGSRPSPRLLGLLLSAPLVSVSVFASIAGNPFNAAVFGTLAIVLAAIALRSANVRPSATPIMPGSGLLLIAFGWVYPHFLAIDRWTMYLSAAPLGLIPCPTLSAVIGVTLLAGLARWSAWRLVLGGAGIAYGAFGAVRLGVTIDYVLLAGAIVLVAGGRAPKGSSRCAL